MTWYDVDFVFSLLEEGVPEDEIFRQIRLRAHGPDQDDEALELMEVLDPFALQQLRSEDYEAFLGRLGERMNVYRKNILEDAEIPENIDDSDGVYSRARARGKELLPRVDRLITMIAGVSSN